MTLKLEVGKTYVTEDGTAVKIIGYNEDEEFPFDASDGDAYLEDGRYFLDVKSEFDLVAALRTPAA